ncbi:MAG TPA: TraR/DksA C4-type zinc finger protein [Terriglobales bacterium]|nr:TraR/DksA C4-type zinc finger protein [Terriglobales bacterium]
MDARELQRYKQLLLAKLDELSATRAEALTPVMGARGPRGDLIDQAAVQTEAELQIHLCQTDIRLSRAIENALARIRVGAFGVCEACKRPISLARLEAVPWTRHCRDCKEQEHKPA